MRERSILASIFLCICVAGAGTVVFRHRPTRIPSTTIVDATGRPIVGLFDGLAANPQFAVEKQPPKRWFSGCNPGLFGKMLNFIETTVHAQATDPCNIANCGASHCAGHNEEPATPTPCGVGCSYGDSAPQTDNYGDDYTKGKYQSCANGCPGSGCPAVCAFTTCTSTAPCTSDAECAGNPNGSVCASGACVTCDTNTNRGCSGTTPYCIPNASGTNVCVTCKDDSTCGAGNHCDPDGHVCVKCYLDSHCQANCEKCNLETNSCDDTCPEGQQCTDGQCVGGGGGCVPGAGGDCATDACGNSCGSLSCDGTSCDESSCSQSCCSGDTSTTGCWTDCNGNPCGAIGCDGVTCDTSGCDESCSGGGGGGDPCADCPYTCLDFFGLYECENYSDPILIDLSGDGFSMTGVPGGVKFDFFGSGKPIRLSWTAAGAPNGWLALDINHDGRIDNGQELFGNATYQPGKAVQRLGFKALALYDTVKFGGNGDGVISGKDAVFSKLRIWVDKNHNGVTDSGELLTLAQAGIKYISLDYYDAHYTDPYGNQFRYRARVTWTDPRKDAKDHWAYDVVLASPDLPVARPKGGK